MVNYVKFKQGLKKDFNTTNQPLTNGMIYFVIDKNNNGSIYYDTIVDGKQATKKGAVHRVKFSGLPIKITGSVIGTGVISQDGETIEINTSTNHSHGLAHQDFTVTLSNDDTNLKWTRLGNQNGEGFWLKSIKGNVKAPAWFQPNYGAGVAFGGGSTKGIISVKYNEPSVRFAGGNGDAPVWYFTITGSNNKTYDLSKIGGHSSDSAKLDHNVTFKIASTANATIGGSGTTTDLSGAAVDLYLPTKISGFNLLQATRFQGNADTSTVAAKLGRGGNTSLPMTFYWDGSKGGQPTWLWGGENGTDMYIYNPSNFKVAHSVSTAGLDHNITFKISKVANATTGEIGVATKLTEALLKLILPASISGFNLIQSTRFQGNADSATVASSANKLNTSAGGNTNPIYFTNGVPVRSTASVGSANQPVYLNNGVITACAGSQSGTEKQQSFKISGSNGTAHWYYLGHLTSNGDNSEVIIDIYSGNGYNGTGNQNTHISIFVKDGWQSTRAAANSFGISYLVDHSDVNATSIRVKGLASADNIIDLYVYLPWGYSDGYYNIKGYYNTWAHKGTRSTAEPTSGEVQNCVFGAFRAGQVYGAVWNDYAEYRRTKKYVQPGYCVIETGKGDLIKSSERLQPGANIVSDTFGFAIGETEQTKTPLAVSGRVLAYPYEDRDSYQAGDPVCSGPNGTISKMTREEVREYPERIIGTVSEIPDYEVWGTGNVKVNNRIWIKVK